MDEKEELIRESVLQNLEPNYASACYYCKTEMRACEFLEVGSGWRCGTCGHEEMGPKTTLAHQNVPLPPCRCSNCKEATARYIAYHADLKVCAECGSEAIPRTRRRCDYCARAEFERSIHRFLTERPGMLEDYDRTPVVEEEFIEEMRVAHAGKYNGRVATSL